jgi:hypothetical protein
LLSGAFCKDSDKTIFGTSYPSNIYWAATAMASPDVTSTSPRTVYNNGMTLTSHY